jgi:cell wall-associated NlpC family hydrolase
MKMLRDRAGATLLIVATAWLSACQAEIRTVPPPAPPAAAPTAPAGAATTVTRMGYSVQVGAFSILENALRLTQTLNSRGLDAYYFPERSGLYKVRFGDYASKDAALHEAKRLLAEAVIQDYFIVGPADHPFYGRNAPARNLREKLAATAESFIGVEYSWGGTTSREGFDCSGLVRAVYQLNGLNLPRSVADQFRAGKAVSRDHLHKGDLVFFSASPGGALSHVGICVGKNVFIHAPGKGKTVREESLDNGYFREHFSGARAYLDEGVSRP